MYMNADVSAIYDSEARGVEAEETRYRGMDEASATPRRAAATYKAFHAV